MPDPLDTAIAQLAYGVTRGALAALAEDGPRIAAGITGAIRSAWASTAVEAPAATPEQIASAMKAAQEAEAAGKMPEILQPPQ